MQDAGYPNTIAKLANNLRALLYKTNVPIFQNRFSLDAEVRDTVLTANTMSNTMPTVIDLLPINRPQKDLKRYADKRAEASATVARLKQLTKADAKGTTVATLETLCC